MNNDIEVFNINESINLAGGNRELALELMAMLIDELPSHRSKIEKFHSTADFDSMKQQVHMLHGSSKCCGTPALMKASQVLEATIDRNDIDQLGEHITNLMTEIDRVLALDVESLG